MASRVAALVLALGLAGAAPAAAAPQADSEGWVAFEGAWSATGHRHPIATEDGGSAATLELSGAVILKKGAGLSLGFQGEVIGFDDGQGTSLGRCVWTDEHGDRIFSRVKGEPVATGRRVTGTITGGTGRYAGLTGEYSLTWQFVVASEDGTLQSRSVSLSGRVRRAGPQ